MITRIVKLHLQPEAISEFYSIFNDYKPKIEQTNGCIKLNIHQEVNQPNLIFTISIWEDEQSLETYRNSDLFYNIWKKVKPLFKDKAEAWSLS